MFHHEQVHPPLSNSVFIKQDGMHEVRVVP